MARKKRIIFADIPEGADVITGPQAHNFADEYGISDIDAGLRFAWAGTVTGFVPHFEKSTETAWHPAAEWAEIEDHFRSHITEPLPSVAVCFGH